MPPSNQAGSSSQKPSQQRSSSKRKLAVAVADPTEPGPVLAHFPSFAPPSETPFSLYRTKSAKATLALEDQPTLLAGETKGVEFFSQNRDELVGGEEEKGGYAAKYVLALHDPSTSTVTLVPAPTYLMAHTVKRLKRAPTAPLMPAQTTNMEARNKLGEAFGTRKAKTQIKTAERNKVDVEGMEGVRELMQEGIESGGAVLPTKEEIKTMNDSSRPIPPPNMLAATPAEAYSLEDIISPAAATSLKFYVKELIDAETDEERIGMLAYRHSGWVNKRLNELCSRDKPNKEKIRCLIYIAVMRGLLKSKPDALGDIGGLMKKYKGVPRAVLLDLNEKFTESVRGAGKAKITPNMNLKMQSYMCVLSLMVDNYLVDASAMATDMNVATSKVTSLLQGLGCVIDVPSAAEREALGLSAAEARGAKRAALKVPLVFKEASRGPAKK